MKTPALRALTLHKTTVTTPLPRDELPDGAVHDVRVRRAFNYAIDRRKLIAVMNGRGVVARGVLPPNLPGYDPERRAATTTIPPRRAHCSRQAHLRAATSIPKLWMRADQTVLMLAQSIQQDLALVGIHVELKPVAWGPLLEAIRQPQYGESFLLRMGS